jgi:DNA replication and repair protein RecF
VERAAPPLMLLDDVMSELDGERRERLSELLRGSGQAVVTATEPDHVPGAGDPDVMLVPVSGGSLSPRRAVAA